MITVPNPSVAPPYQKAEAHQSTMLDLFFAVTNDCVSVRIEPVHVAVHNFDAYGNGPWLVDVQFEGQNTDAVDALAGCYGLAYDDGETANYTRRGRVVVNGRPGTVNVYTGRPADRITLIREWVAKNYSAESKRLVAEGAEATVEDRAAFARAEAAGLFEVVQ